MSFSSRAQATTLRMLTKYGEAVTASRKVEGAYNVDTSATATSTDTTYSGYGYPDAYTAYEVDGDLIQASDIKLYYQTGTLPLTGDVLTVNSKAYRVMNVQPIRAQTSDCLYIVQLRI